MSFGVDYYPEHWSEDRIEVDANAMSSIGFTIVRLAEFSWVKLEPRPGRFEFQWLDRAIEILSEHSLQIVLGTPSAAPPIWLVDKHPDVLPVDELGNRRGFGGRHHNCQSNETYRAYVRRMVAEMAQHYAEDSRIIGWQIDNELGNSHDILCYCNSCRQRFHDWLRQRYGDIERLNDNWGTIFWGQSYANFSQIPLPFPTPNTHNPSLLLDWRRFRSDLVCDFLHEQARIIREPCPEHFITHNFMSFLEKTDYFKLARELDFVSHDQYPIHFREGRDFSRIPHIQAAALDLSRGNKSRTFWIMEQQSGATGWEIVGRTPRPGQLRLWTYQSVAHGADTVVYYRWRTALFGPEQFWEGILPHHAQPGRRHAEIAATIGELTPIMQRLAGTTPSAEAAILFDYNQLWALRVQPHHPDLSYVDHIQAFYRAFHDANIPIEMISRDSDFNQYRIIIAPLLYLTSFRLAAELRSFVDAGGHLLLTMRTGAKEWNNRVREQQLPGLEFSELLGITVDEYDCLRDEIQEVKWVAENDVDLAERVTQWCDIIRAESADVLAIYERDFYAGTPAITRNAFGAGFAYYAGTRLGQSMIQRLIDFVTNSASIRPLMETPNGVEVVRRRSQTEEFLFVLNHSEELATLPLSNGFQPFIGGDSARQGRITLEPYGVAVITSERETPGS